MPIEKSSANALLRKRCASAQREVYFVFRRQTSFIFCLKVLEGVWGNFFQEVPPKNAPPTASSVAQKIVEKGKKFEDFTCKKRGGMV
jgi:hypothetical protein